MKARGEDRRSIHKENYTLWDKVFVDNFACRAASNDVGKIDSAILLPISTRQTHASSWPPCH
jgi:hypothetical protein